MTLSDNTSLLRGFWTCHKFLLTITKAKPGLFFFFFLENNYVVITLRKTEVLQVYESLGKYEAMDKYLPEKRSLAAGV